MMIHCVDLYKPPQEQESQRLLRAQASWLAFDEEARPLDGRVRTSEILGSNRRLHFIHDVLDAGVKRADKGSDVLVLTNADSGICVDAAEYIKSSVAVFGICYAHRRDWYKAIRCPISLSTNMKGGASSPGVDLVSFSVEWWEDVGRKRIPDLLLGVEGWDWVMKFESGSEIPNVVWHEYHQTPVWARDRTEVANLWNRMKCFEWSRGYGGDLSVWPALQEYGLEYPISSDRFFEWTNGRMTSIRANQLSLL